MLAFLVDFARLARAGFVMVREGVLALAPTADLPPLARFALRATRLIERGAARDESREKRLSAAFARLGPSYIKLGQFLATRPDVVGARVARDLETLQDRLPPFSAMEAEAAVAAALGRPVSELFAWFGPPVAAASIAQVHRARLKDAAGAREVAVKVLRPGIGPRFRRDLRAYYTAAQLMERFIPATRRLRLVGVVDTLARSVAMEMDLRLEAAAISEMAQNSVEDPGIRLPKVEWDRTAKTVLTTEWIDGIPLSDLERLKSAGHDLERLAQIVIQSFLRHAMRDGFFHADMHQGNLLVDGSGTIVLIDLGITGRLSSRERRFLATILWSFIRRDYTRGAEVHFEAGYVPRTQRVADFAQALRAIGEPIHEKAAEDIAMSKLLAQLFEYTEMFEMRTRLELVMLQKTMVVVEGVGRSLDPKLDIWCTAEPVVSDYISRQLGPRGMADSLSELVSRAGRLIADAPDFLRRLENLSDDLARAGEEGLRLSRETVEAIADAEARRGRARTLALWIIAALLAVLVAMAAG